MGKLKIACLQFNPKLGDLDGNVRRADRILEESQAEALGIGLLVLPEMAFSGYNFPDQQAIKPFLEPTASGLTAEWAKRTAQRLGCWVVAGYPEIDTGEREPELPEIHYEENITPSEIPDDSVMAAGSTSPPSPPDPNIRAYNSALVVAPTPTPRVVGHYRKSHLYYTDYTWARENPAKTPFYTAVHPIASSSSSPDDTPPRQLNVALGICMDMNPYKFEAPYTDYEFGTHCRDSRADIIILPTAWLTLEVEKVFPHGFGIPQDHDEERDTVLEKMVEEVAGEAMEREEVRRKLEVEMQRERRAADWDTVRYWAGRLRPIWDGSEAEGDGEVSGDGEGEEGGERRRAVFVSCNRVGVEGDATYVGSSSVLEVETGRIRGLGSAGKGVEKLLVVEVDV
ncbi:carbon-nitrogen hydrolase [Ascodesmis nigricans]|uniref:Carbon-nitrogen hydrolase n=1 Tax=Ascodesmis nigricans TaxID=341454 RepID=A0A4S2MMR6_9PEZI|nr:carbon-nitrogen hydrolase [Ascodesmis nigricans]